MTNNSKTNERSATKNSLHIEKKRALQEIEKTIAFMKTMKHITPSYFSTLRSMTQDAKIIRDKIENEKEKD